MRRDRALAVVLCAVLVTAACGSRPSEEELQRLLDEAKAANAEKKASHKEETRLGFTLTVSGQIRKPSTTLAWTDLQALGTSTVETVDIQSVDKKTATKFRGVLVRDLLERFDADPNAAEITFVCIDGFRATVRAADARKYRMLLAIEADGRPIDRSAGGPIYLVHPFSEAPELKELYPDRFWAFYVTHMVVGTEDVRVEVGKRVFDRRALENLPPVKWQAAVGWKVEWPAEPVHLRGVKLVHALDVAGVKLPPNGRVVIRGKAPVHDDPEKPISIAVADLARCRPILTLRWGNDEKPIPAKLGGPVALAITPCGAEYGARPWVTFVEAIRVVTE